MPCSDTAPKKPVAAPEKKGDFIRVGPTHTQRITSLNKSRQPTNVIIMIIYMMMMINSVDVKIIRVPRRETGATRVIGFAPLVSSVAAAQFFTCSCYTNEELLVPDAPPKPGK
ncbi:hypothetical protein Y032_0971g3252 [Ancylostoma ceylanicum]|uniref:Uncharacterized protein n=1 Tax=Ancylostoma ceylanicum TaxID=53326 RepID=A0A016W9Y4_9BILA|nr:hypothetical protein Y032_0971g3252 [Ancylostoma ceylanicum]